MSGAIGSAKGNGVQPVQVAGLQVSVSTYGLPIPIVWGQNRLSGNLLWYGNFQAIPVSSGGGKGGGGSTPSSYNYVAAGLVGLCEGTINGISQVWNSKDATTLTALGISLSNGSYPQTPWGYLTTNFPTQALGYSGVATVESSSFQLSSSAQMPNILYEVQGLLQFGYLNQLAQSFTVSGYTFTCAAHGYILNQCVRLYCSVPPTPLLNGVDYYVYPIDANHFSLYPTPYQPAATSGNPTVLTCTTAGSGNIVQNWIQGANPSDVITDFIQNTTYGVNGNNAFGSISSTKIPLAGLVTGAACYSNYCVANGIFISPALITQSQASDIITKICDITNSAPVWSQGSLNIIPYGDTAITGNGVTFTPNTTVRYTFTDDDYLGDKDDPIIITRSNPADAFNQVQVSFPDRTNQYNPNVAQAQDQANIDLYGLRAMPIIQHDYITDAQVAKNVAQVKLQRVLYIRNQYSFKVGWKYVLLEPMDLVSLTDVALGLNGLVVRVTSIEEDDEETLSIIAEDYLVNNATIKAAAPQLLGGATTAMNADPGLSNTPVIFDAPGALTDTGYELWMATAGGKNWGGAQVWVSNDGTSYVLIGTITSPAKYGTLTNSVPAGSDPDASTTFQVDLSVSNGTMLSGSTADADIGNTLCLINEPYNQELISYSTASLTSAHHYNLTSYTRRGVHNTNNAAHAANVPFIRLDGNIFKYAYNPTWVGTTIYVKLLPFNLYGAGQYTLSMVQPTTYLIGGSISRPSNVTGFTATQNGNVVVFGWVDVVDYALKGYDIGYAPQGTTIWSNFEILTEAARGTEMTNAAVPPGTWVFGIRARDISNQLSPVMATVSMVVTNSDPLIADAEQSPGWLGTLVNLYRHWTGVLVPMGQNLASSYVQVSAPSAPTLSMVPGGAIVATTYYAKITYTSVAGETIASPEASLLVILNDLLQVASPSATSGAVGWNVYVSTGTGTETLQNATPIAIGSSWTLPTTGLVSGAAQPSSNTTGWDVFNTFVPDPYLTASYTAPTIDTGYNDNLRAYSTSNVVMGVGQTGLPSYQFMIDTWLTGGSDPASYEDWTIGYVNMRYLNGQLSLSITAGSVPYITEFAVVVDAAPVIENVANVVIGAGGTAVTFPNPYHSAPYVQATVVGSSALYATASALSATGCTFHVFDHTGADVGGTITYSATGD